MTFQNGEMLVFDRSGARIGTLTTWSVTRARTYRISEVEDFGFLVPQRDEAGVDVLTDAVRALLVSDNIIYIENEVEGLPPWAGAISEADMSDGAAYVTAISGLSLFDSVETLLIEQSDGESGTIAARLVAAANAKKGAHGDLLVGFAQDSTTPNYGLYEYEGDILQGLMDVAERTLSEFYVEPTIAAGGGSIAFTLHWSQRLFHDFRSSVTLTDGPDGNVASGAHALYSGLEVIGRARLRGATTNVADYVDYSSVASFIEEIAPEVEVSVDLPPNFRHREDLQLTVSFGYSEAIQRALAEQIQQKYVNYYKTFLYAFHERNGMPWLPGYDWQGPGQGYPERKITETDFRTINKLGLIGKAAIIAVDSDRYDRLTATDEADITDWEYRQVIDTITAVGMARSPKDPDGHVIADSGDLYEYGEDETPELLFHVTNAGETLVSVATDPTEPDLVWCLYTTASGARVRWYDYEDGTVIGSFDMAGETDANDFWVNAEDGQFYMVSTGGGTIQRRDINSGTSLSTLPSGFGSVAGISGTDGFLYVINSTGNVRILFSEGGNLAGTHDTGVDASGLFVDPDNRSVFVVRPNGNIRAYDATIALAAVDDEEGATGAPGFDTVRRGRYCHIVLTDDLTYRPWKRNYNDAYVVQAGDTLWKIAKAFYGVGAGWRGIYRHNKVIIGDAAVAHGQPANSHRLFAGTIIGIPGAQGLTEQEEAQTPKVRYLQVAPKKANWEQNVVPGPIGEPDIIELEWVVGRQIVGTVKAKRCKIVDPKVVIYGEEGRVNDWFPKRDGYGQYLARKVYWTRAGSSRNKGPGWYPQDWDIPDAEWQIEPPPWPEGEAYLAAYLARRNSEVTVQSFAVVNRDNLWASLRLGGVYGLTLTLQGPVPGGISLDVRLIGFAPSEATGSCELFAEAYIP